MSAEETAEMTDTPDTAPDAARPTASDAAPEAVPPTARDGAPTPEAEPPAARRETPAALWVLVVLGGFLAGAAFWYALFGGPQIIGSEPSLPPGTAQLANIEPTATPAAPLSADEARAVLSAIDYTESNDASTTEYDHATARMLEHVDLLGFARTTLQAKQSILWTDVGAAGPRTITGAEKAQRVEEALGYWVKMRSTDGTPDALPLDDTIGVRTSPPLQADRNLADSLFEVIAQGLHPLGLMFGAQDTDNEWSWHIESVKLTGATTAEVTYSATVKPDQGWHFIDPDKLYVKELVFSPGADGTWKLAGFTNFDTVSAQFNANVSDPERVTVDEWWGIF